MRVEGEGEALDGPYRIGGGDAEHVLYALRCMQIGGDGRWREMTYPLGGGDAEDVLYAPGSGRVHGRLMEG